VYCGKGEENLEFGRGKEYLTKGAPVGIQLGKTSWALRSLVEEA